MEKKQEYMVSKSLIKLKQIMWLMVKGLAIKLKCVFFLFNLSFKYNACN